MQLEQLGWSAFFEEHFRPFAQSGLIAARVVIENRGGYRVAATCGELAAEISGRFRHDGIGAGDFPAVGDWLAIQAHPAEGKATIQAVLPRRTRFSRTAAGKQGGEQIIAANVDDVLIVAGLDAALNCRRLERYLTLTRESGAEPIVVLTKADLCPDAEDCRRRVEAVGGGTPVHVVSTVTGAGMTGLAGSLRPGRTVALLGPSGVGKSTLINHWCGEARLKTQPVRERDQKGRHTTTRRQLIPLPSGALIIDTPGMRELQLWEGEHGIQETFADIEELAVNCRFADCGHDTEPGCAVRQAIDRGELESDRLESHRKLTRELRHFEQRHDKRAQAATRRKIKPVMRSMRTYYKRKD